MIKKFIKLVGKKIKNIARSGKKEVKSSKPLIKEAVIPQEQAPAAKEVTCVSKDSVDSRPKPSRRRRTPKKGKKSDGGVQLAPVVEAGKDEYVWRLEQFQVKQLPDKARFHDFDLPLPIMHAIADLGFEYCTPIQEKSLPIALNGADLVGRAQTGTGKSAAFIIGMLARFINQPPETKRPNGTPRGLIVAPTRELVMQIEKDAKLLAKYCNISVESVFGGVDYQKQKDQLQNKRVDLIAATPGRLLDYARQRIVSLDRVEVLVLDEADRMLDMGFIPDVRKIVGYTPSKEQRQTMLYSATITEEVKRLAAQWSIKPVTIEIEKDQVTVDTVNQLVYLTTAKEKYAILYNMITKQIQERVLVFTNRRDEARKLTDRLKRNGINCAMLSGEVPQKQRMSRLENFREGKIKVLVATDVAGRGIHIDGISHVINYTLPYEPEDYVHRIGRTGRAGAKGISVSFACEEGAFYLPEIETFIGRKLPCGQPENELLIPPPRGSSHTHQKDGPDKSSDGRPKYHSKHKHSYHRPKARPKVNKGG